MAIDKSNSWKFDDRFIRGMAASAGYLSKPYKEFPNINDVKFGIDPTAPDLHLGHAVILRKLRMMQDEGHTVQLVVGDFTAQIGDPTGQDKTRPQLTEEEIKANVKTYLDQAYKILNPEKTKVYYNSVWLSKMNLSFFKSITSIITLAQITERDSFKKRLAEKRPVSFNEILYPVCQAIDSMHLNPDIEIGGSDQLWNLMFTRDLQEKIIVLVDDDRMPKFMIQSVVTFDILPGTDGVHKMSKSLNNYIAFNDTAKDMYGKIMSIDDKTMLKYVELLTDFPLPTIKNMHPKKAKQMLARYIVTKFYDNETAISEEKKFEETFSRTRVFEPEKTLEFFKSDNLCLSQIVFKSGLAVSHNEAKKLVLQGAVRVDRCTLKDPDTVGFHDLILQVGKRGAVRILFK